MSQFELFSPGPEPSSWFDALPAGDGLRYYQQEAAEAVWRGFHASRSLLAVMATGLGKTQLFVHLADQWRHRCSDYGVDNPNVLILAHRDELVEQARARIEQMTGEYAEIEQGDLRASTRARIVVGSVQTVYRKSRLARLGKDRFGLVIPDEAHHYVAKTYRRPLEFFEGAKVLGVTATPDRGDEMALGQVFDDVAYVMDIMEGIEAGYLVPIRGQSVRVEAVDISQVGKSAGDLSAAQLDEVMVKGVEGIVAKTLEICPERQAVAFFPGVKSAEYAAAAFNARRPDSACFISGSTPEELRKAYVRRFKAGEFRYLCNCMVATEGFDAPATSAIILGRPTLSRALYAQMAGRGTRVLPGVVDGLPGASLAAQRREAIAASAKPDCLLLDFVGNAGKHALVGPEDLLGGSYSDEEIEEAKKRRRAGKDGGDVRASLEAARRELQRIAEATRAQVSARVQAFDPFHVFGMEIDDEHRYADRFGRKPATKRQLDALRQLGVEDAHLNGMSKKAAGQLLDRFKDRNQRGMASYRMTRQLQKHGIHAHEIPYRDAKAALDYLAGECGWGKKRPVDPDRLHSLCFPMRQPGED